MDTFYLIIVLAFFVIAIAYTFGCDRLMGDENE